MPTPEIQTTNLDLLGKIAKRFDGWVNGITGLGILGRDRAASTEFLADTWLDDQTLSHLFHYDDICNRVVSIFPKEALRRGFEVKGPNAEVVEAELHRLRIGPLIREGATWGRLFGGAVGVLGLGGDPLSPAPATGRIEYVDIYDKRCIQRVKRFDDPRHSLYSQAEIFRITPEGRTPFDVHRSRCLVFGGPLTGNREKEYRQGWDMSSLQIVYRVLMAFNNGHLSLDNMLTDASQAVFKMRGLLALIAGDKALLEKRAAILDLFRGLNRSVLLDADSGEEFTRVPMSFQSVPESMDRLVNRVAMATEIPVTILAGQAPAGLNATGDADMRAFYDRVESYRVEEITPHFRSVLRFVAPGHEVVFPSLWQPTAKEQAEVRKLVADTDALYIDRDVVTPEEVALSRFAGEKSAIKIDPTLRAKPALPAGAPPPTTKTEIEITPSDLATIVTVNEARAAEGLPSLPGPDGALTIAEFKAKHAAPIAAAALAESGEKPNGATPNPTPPTTPPTNPRPAS